MKPDRPKVALPEAYKEFIEAFDLDNLEGLPPRRQGVDHAIEINPEVKLPDCGIRPTSPKEKQQLKVYIDKYGRRGWIRKSKSPSASPIIFADKKDVDDLRLCIDYRKINAITKKNRYPLPRIDALIDKLKRGEYFVKLDMKEAYKAIRIKEGDEWKTAFKCLLGLYEWMVMPEGLCNAGATYQAFIDQVLNEMTDEEIFAYLDDMLIWGETVEEVRARTKQVLQHIIDAGIVVNLQKCQFEVEKVSILGYVISNGKVHMEKNRIDTITEWPQPTNIREIQAFTGFSGFYRRFIEGYSRICRGLTNLTRKVEKGSKFIWTPEAEKSFQDLKDAFTSEPVLKVYDPEKPSILRTDASGYALCGIHLQKHGNMEHPVEYWSRKMTDEETRYTTPDQELLAVVDSLEHWRHHFEGANHKIIIYSDHANLRYFLTTTQLSRRQAHWAEKMSKYDFEIKHTPGKKNPADAPSRRPDYRPTKDADSKPERIELHLENPQAVLSALACSIPFNNLPFDTQQGLAELDPSYKEPPNITLSAIAPELKDQLLEAQNNDNFVYKMKVSDPGDDNAKGRENWTFKDDILYFKERAYIPQPMRKQILEEEHDKPLAGHFGRERTRDLLARGYFWPGMTDDCEEHVRTCDKCARNKANRHAEYGHLQPQTPPERPWSRVGVDFITDLPKTKRGNDSIMVIVDYGTKMVHLDPCSMQGMTGIQASKLIRRNIIRLHGVPDEITSDRGPQFVNDFAATLSEQIQTKLNATTAYHPRGNGQTERVNSPITAYLRTYAENETEWDEWVDLAEFAYNNTKHATTKVTPFFANSGTHPRTIPGKPEGVLKWNDEAAQKHAKKMRAIYTKLSENLQQAQIKTKERFDNSHIDKSFEVNSKVWVRTTNQNLESAATTGKTKRYRAKLDPRKTGPFTILEKIGPVDYKLDLPKPKKGGKKVYNIFHVSLLEPYNERSEDQDNDNETEAGILAALKINEPSDEVEDEEDSTSEPELDSAEVTGVVRQDKGCDYYIRPTPNEDPIRVTLAEIRPYMAAVRKFYKQNPSARKPGNIALSRMGLPKTAQRIVGIKNLGNDRWAWKVKWNRGWGTQWERAQELLTEEDKHKQLEFLRANPDIEGPNSIFFGKTRHTRLGPVGHGRRGPNIFKTDREKKDIRNEKTRTKK
jgi:hypothetical protein